MIDIIYHMLFSLTQVARILGSPQHRLIHLCEKGVVVPDREARGRGTSRQFSKRTLLDFAVALEMRRLELPLSFTRAVLQVLQSFEVEARRIMPAFALPDSLVTEGAPNMLIMILDGERLYFSFALKRHAPRVFGGVSIRRPPVRGRGRHHEGLGHLHPAKLNAALAGARTRIDVDVSRIARDLEERLSSA